MSGQRMIPPGYVFAAKAYEEWMCGFVPYVRQRPEDPEPPLRHKAKWEAWNRRRTRRAAAQRRMQRNPRNAVALRSEQFIRALQNGDIQAFASYRDATGIMKTELLPASYWASPAAEASLIAIDNESQRTGYLIPEGLHGRDKRLAIQFRAVAVIHANIWAAWSNALGKAAGYATKDEIQAWLERSYIPTVANTSPKHKGRDKDAWVATKAHFQGRANNEVFKIAWADAQKPPHWVRGRPKQAV